MNQEPFVNPDFMFKEPLSLRAIDPVWVRKRAAELGLVNGEPDINGALTEVADNLTVRMKNNALPDTPVMVYAPINEEDPYILGIAIHRITPRGIRKPKEHVVKEPPLETDKNPNALRDDFENMLFEEGDYPPSIVDRDGQDEYLLPWVNSQWMGFQMYHRRFTNAGSPEHKAKYNNALGRYVIGKIQLNGTVGFHHQPYRHKTKASALEEANRLVDDYNTPFAVFRCLDIVAP